MSEMISRWTVLLSSLGLSFVLAHAQSPRPRITGISHLSVYTSNPLATENFYAHDLGAFKGPAAQDPAAVRYYFNPIQFVEVLPLPSNLDSVSRLDHVAFTTENAEALRTYLSSRHIDVPSQVTQTPDGSTSFVVKDPEGNRVEFVQPSTHPSPVPHNPLSDHIIHVGYIVHNPDKEAAFYRETLGFRPYWHGGRTDTVDDWISMQVPDGHDWMEFMVTKPVDGTGIPAAMTQDTAGVLNHFSLGVNNIEQSMNVLYAGDRLQNKHSPPQIGRDGKWQLNLYDPDGTRAEMMEFQPSVKPCCSAFTAESPTK
jgi:catechol 2,3-dioxygenase-like lactoylglutathione lyase family enzyme